ncbi:hypothetical protein GIB67_030817 [Kingdonia uniflora]|uniref:Uncharacterized protein n=1 Tax=Kingdonia uniflora TaxID=39325 RepID=A0A7J7L383_9MAGN|nr:hypothetical protein GIB67_030817 [Kingdonia uniflora]
MVRNRSQRIRHAAEGRLAIKTAEVRERIFGSLGYDAELSMRACQLEGLDTRSRELEYARYFYESFFCVFMRDSAERERWEREKKMRRITPEDVLRFYGVKNFKASGGSYFYASVTRRRFFDLISTGRTWNDNIIWVKGMKSIVERKESLLGEVAEEETELKLVLGELSLSKKKRVKTSGTTVSGEVTQGKRRRIEPLENSGEEVIEGRSASMNDLKEAEKRARLAILQGKEDTSQMESKLKRVKSALEKNLARAKTDALKEVEQLKANHAVAIGQLQVEAKANLDETIEKHDRLGRHLMRKGYSQGEVVAIKADTYAEEEEEEVEVLGVVDGLDGVSPQMVLDNQRDDVELSEGGSEKVELDASHVREDHTLMYNQEFVKQFARMKEANKNREDQYVKAHFRLEKLNQVVSDLTRQVEEKDSRIKKGLEGLSEVTERAENL